MSCQPGAPLAAIGVVVPAHNEEEHLAACLEALWAATAGPVDHGLTVRVVVALDSCRDHSAALVEAEAKRWRHRNANGAVLTALDVHVRNVGAARSAGCSLLTQRFAHLPHAAAWLASTDADSVVPEGWLQHQVRLHAAGVDAWVGTIEVDDHGEHPVDRLRHFRAHYANSHRLGDDGEVIHSHVHGTNLGLTVAAYRRVGGFAALATGEDHELLARLRAEKITVRAGTEMPVLTSSRRWGRAPDGFAATLAAF